jgi:adenosylhomocysteine nucleosidase
MRILVTFAVKAEFAPWSSRHAFVPYEFENWGRRREFDLFKANIAHNEVTVLLTGIGKTSATEAMDSIPLAAHDVCISTGLAGSLRDELRPSDVVVARAANTIDGAIIASSDESLRQIAVFLAAKPVDVALTSEKIVSTALAKDELRQFGSIVEMESAHVLAAAQRAQTPAVVVRAISDAADEDLPVDFARILDSQGRLKVGALLKEVGLSPHRIPLLIQFGRQSRVAAKSLADFLDRYTIAIAQQWRTPARNHVEEVSAT